MSKKADSYICSTCDVEHEEAINAALEEMGLPRTRENYLYLLFGGEPLPEEWGPEDEARNLPADLRTQIT